MSGLFDAVTNIFDTILGGGPEAPQVPSIDLTPLTESNTLLQQQIAETNRKNQELLSESQKRQDELSKQLVEMNKPKAEMPTATSNDVRTAKRKAAAQLVRRGGRASTILSDQDALGGA